jgi:hypothetical protein
VALPVVALVFQLVPPLLLVLIARGAYGEWRWLPEGWERPVSLATLGGSALVSWLLGSVSVYGLLTRARARVAVPLVACCCVPALLGGAVYLHGLLVFLAVV